MVGFAEVGTWNLLSWLLWNDDKAGLRSLEGSGGWRDSSWGGLLD